MIVEDQSEVRAFLLEAMAREAGAAPVETVETHISLVILGPEQVFKLKRAVRLPYVDFSTPAQRLAACSEEIARNRLTAPRHYLGVRRISRGPGGLAFDGAGPLVDAVVVMRRFDQDQLLDRLAHRGALGKAEIEALAAEVAALHAQVPVAPAASGLGQIAAVLAVNEAALATTRVFEPDAVAAFNARFRDAAARHAACLDARARAGRVRRCHGDLHLGNIFLEDGQPVLFDCIEFNDAIATVDVLYDLAFLLMDLDHRGLADLANVAMNRYLDRTGDDEGAALLPFFMALRAAVRAHVAATTADEGGSAAKREEAHAYFDRALALLEPAPAELVAIGGLSGSGKSTVAEALAPRLGPRPGARLLSSDRIRKRLAGVAAEVRLPAAAYTPAKSARVYDALVAGAGALAGAGVAVVADAVFAREAERHRIAAAARAAGVPFRGYWLEAEPALLRQRVAARRGGPSDATLAVLEAQLADDPGRIDWHRLDASQPTEALVAAICARRPDLEEASRRLSERPRCG